MDVEKLREKRTAMEQSIARFCNDLVLSLHSETGFSPRNISIRMVDVTSLGDKEKRYVVGKCEVDIEV